MRRRLEKPATRQNPPNGGGGFHLSTGQGDNPEPATSPRKPARQCCQRKTAAALSALRGRRSAALRAEARRRATCATSGRFLAWLEGRGRRARGRARPTTCCATRASSSPRGRPTAGPSRPATRPTASWPSRASSASSTGAATCSHDPAAAARATRASRSACRGRSSRREEARRIIEAPDAKTLLGAARPRDPRDPLRHGDPRERARAASRPDDVDTEERVLRVVLGKGRKDRNVPLTRAAAAAIEAYLVKGRAAARRARKAARVSSSSATRGGTLNRCAPEHARQYTVGEEGRGQEARHLPHLPPQRGHAPPPGPRRHPAHPGAARPRLARHDRALHARRDLGPARGRRACPPARPVASLPHSPTSRTSGPGTSPSRFRVTRAACCPGSSSSLQWKGVRDVRRVDEAHSSPSRASSSKRPSARGRPLSPAPGPPTWPS